MFSIVDYKEPTYNRGRYHYPEWAIYLGWAIAATSLAPIPGCAAMAVWQAKGNVRAACASQIVLCPCGCEAELDERSHEAHGKDDEAFAGCAVLVEKEAMVKAS